MHTDRYCASSPGAADAGCGLIPAGTAFAVDIAAVAAVPAYVVVLAAGTAVADKSDSALPVHTAAFAR